MVSPEISHHFVRAAHALGEGRALSAEQLAGLGEDERRELEALVARARLQKANRGELSLAVAVLAALASPRNCAP